MDSNTKYIRASLLCMRTVFLLDFLLADCDEPKVLDSKRVVRDSLYGLAGLLCDYDMAVNHFKDDLLR